MSGHAIETFHLIAEWAAVATEVLAVGVIVAGVTIVAVHRGTLRALFQFGRNDGYETARHQLGRALLLGLELMVAADVIRTVTFAPTLVNVSVLGLLVLVRTFLSWTMSVEVDGHWPWQTNTRFQAEAAPGKTIDEP